MTAKIIALCNQKGGVGKTTTATHLARAAVLEGMRVLAVDADPQGNLTVNLVAEIEEDSAGLADVLTHRVDTSTSDVVVPGIWEGLSVVPTTGETLGVVRDELVISGAGRESRLRRALEEVREEYDLIIIDCAPALDQLAINGLTAADAVVIPTAPRLHSVNGIAKLISTVQLVREHYNSSLTVSGLLLNCVNRTSTSAHWVNEVNEVSQQFDLHVFEPYMSMLVAINDSTETQTALDEWSKEGAELMGSYKGFLASIMQEDN